MRERKWTLVIFYLEESEGGFLNFLDRLTYAKMKQSQALNPPPSSCWRQIQTDIKRSAELRLWGWRREGVLTSKYSNKPELKYFSGVVCWEVCRWFALEIIFLQKLISDNHLVFKVKHISDDICPFMAPSKLSMHAGRIGCYLHAGSVHRLGRTWNRSCSSLLPWRTMAFVVGVLHVIIDKLKKMGV